MALHNIFVCVECDDFYVVCCDTFAPIAAASFFELLDGPHDAIVLLGRIQLCPLRDKVFTANLESYTVVCPLCTQNFIFTRPKNEP